MFLRLATKSLLHRKGSIILIIFAISVSIFVTLAVDHIRHQAKSSFANSVSGVDLIVGAKTGNLNLLLYSVFRLGSPTNNISWQSYKHLQANSAVNWSIPISLGDSHKGYRVLGTTKNYFKHFSYGNKHKLSFSQGEAFNDVFELVLGAKVAASLGYQVGDSITLSHGIGPTSFTHHDESPFVITGVLAPTGTPVDQTVHVSLQGLEAVHMSPALLNKAIAENTLSQLQPQSITAVLVGLKSKMMVFNIQRAINTSFDEPLLAILPGVVLSELWQTMLAVENTLRLISALVVLSSLLGLSAMLLTSIKQRSKEIQLLRIIGASPFFIYWFIELEALLITLTSTLISMASLVAALYFAQSYLLNSYGLLIDINVLSNSSISVLGIIFLLTFVGRATTSHCRLPSKCS